jgi:hypothetical protein
MNYECNKQGFSFFLAIRSRSFIRYSRIIFYDWWFFVILLQRIFVTYIWFMFEFYELQLLKQGDGFSSQEKGGCKSQKPKTCMSYFFTPPLPYRYHLLYMRNITAPSDLQQCSSWTMYSCHGIPFEHSPFPSFSAASNSKLFMFYAILKPKRFFRLGNMN